MKPYFSKADKGGLVMPASAESVRSAEATAYRESEAYRNRYSQQARLYHSMLDDVCATIDSIDLGLIESQAVHQYDIGHKDVCLEQCLTLLQFPRLPMFTRVETLHMAAAACKVSSTAVSYLESALKIIDQLVAPASDTRMQQYIDKFRADNVSLMAQEKYLQDVQKQSSSSGGPSDAVVPGDS